jgi:hypothetical protein
VRRSRAAAAGSDGSLRRPSGSRAAPGGDLVLFYDSGAPFFNGIVRIGEFDGDIVALARQGNDLSTTIARVE